jgi:hypothetical protein
MRGLWGRERGRRVPLQQPQQQMRRGSMVVVVEVVPGMQPAMILCPTSPRLNPLHSFFQPHWPLQRQERATAQFSAAAVAVAAAMTSAFPRPHACGSSPPPPQPPSSPPPFQPWLHPWHPLGEASTHLPPSYPPRPPPPHPPWQRRRLLPVGVALLAPPPSSSLRPPLPPLTHWGSAPTTFLPCQCPPRHSPWLPWGGGCAVPPRLRLRLRLCPPCKPLQWGPQRLL